MIYIKQDIWTRQETKKHETITKTRVYFGKRALKTYKKGRRARSQALTFWCITSVWQKKVVWPLMVDSIRRNSRISSQQYFDFWFFMISISHTLCNKVIIFVEVICILISSSQELLWYVEYNIVFLVLIFMWLK